MRRLKTARRPPIYPKTPGHLPCSSLTHPFRCPHAVHRCPSVDSGLIDGATNAVIATIPVGSRRSNTWVAVNPDTDRIYVTKAKDDTVYVIDGALVAPAP